MKVSEAIRLRRSIRKFKQEPIEKEVLEKLVEAARIAPQGANMQGLKYIIVEEKALLEPIFKTTKWAGHIHPAGDPQDDEKPVAYIVVLCDTQIKKGGFDTDAGAAVQNILLTAAEEGLGTCWLGAIDRKGIVKILNIPDRFQIHSIVAVGYPTDNPIMEEMQNENDSYKYYKDKTGKLHVPKRRLKDILFYNEFTC